MANLYGGRLSNLHLHNPLSGDYYDINILNLIPPGLEL